MPVDVASGVFFTAAHDIVIAGIVPIVWRRCFSTGLLARPEPSALGAGWVHYFDMTLRRIANGFALFGHDGQQVQFPDKAPLNAAAQMELRREGTRLAVYHWHGWDGEVKKLMFDPPTALDQVSRLDAVETPGGHALRLQYDPAGRLLAVEQSVEGRGIELAYHPNGTIARISATSPTSKPVQEVEYAYSTGPIPKLVAAITRNGTAQRYGYADAGFMLEEVGHSGGAFHMRYDPAGRCVEVRGDNDYQLRRFSFDSAMRVTRVADSLGNATSYLANERGQIERIRCADGSERARAFDQHARISEETDALGVTRHEYDLRGNRVATTRGAIRRSWTFNDVHQVTACVRPDKTAWRFAYERGLLTSIEGPDGTASRMAYDEGVLKETLDPTGVTVRISHSPDWSSETFEGDHGLFLRRTYDPWLRTLREDDAHGLAFEQEFDASGRVSVKRQADGSETRFIWNTSGDPLDVVNANGHRTRTDYTAYGQVSRFTDPNGLSHEFESDSEGRLTAIVNPKRERASFAYDSMGRVTSQTGFDGQTQSWQYDAGGRLIRRVKPDGVVLDFELDTAGRLQRILSSGRELCGWRFDESGNMIEARTPSSTIAIEWKSGRLMAETQNGRRVSYSRAAWGAIESLELEGGPGALSFERNAIGQPTAMRAGGELEETYHYSDAGFLLERVLVAGAATEQTGYDSRRRVQGRRIVQGGQTLFAQVYSYDPVSNLTSVRDVQTGTRQYTYDPGKRLTRSAHSSGTEREFLYDDCGNLLAQAGLEITYGSGGVLERLGPQRFEHDACGRPTRSTDRSSRETTYLWDELDHLTEVRMGGTVVRYAYDALGRRVSKSVNDVETQFYWAGDHLLGEETDDAGTKIYWTPDLIPMFSWSQKEGKKHFVNGANVVPAAVINEDGSLASGITIREFGATVSDGAVPFRLMGQYADQETGLHYNRHRYYNPLTGRFLTTDPIGFAGQWNLFQYAPNAVGFADPYGLTCGNTGCPNFAVYALVDNVGTVNYVGITMQDPQVRCNQHNYTGKNFDHMEIVANVGTAPNGGLTRQEARSLEGSSLYNVNNGLHAMGGANPVATTPLLQNAVRLNGQYYHSYAPGHGSYQGPGNTGPVLNTNGINQYW